MFQSGKEKPQTHQKNTSRPEQTGAVIHGDLFDLPKECEGATKGALFVDSGTSNSWLYFINGKTEQHLAPVIKHLLSTVVSDGYTPRQIWYDGESAIRGNVIEDILEQYDIELKLTPDSQQNLAETKIDKLRTMAKHMVHDRSLDDTFWVHAFRYANMISTMIPHSRLESRTGISNICETRRHH